MTKGHHHHQQHPDKQQQGKRQRQTQSCDRCRIRKRKCDDGDICQNCLKANAPCTRLAVQQKRGPKTTSSSSTTTTSTKKLISTNNKPSLTLSLSNTTNTTTTTTTTTTTARHSTRVLKRKPISYQEPAEDEDVFEVVEEEPPLALEEAVKFQSNTTIPHQQQEQVSHISQFLTSAFATILDDSSLLLEKPSSKLPSNLLEFQGSFLPSDQTTQVIPPNKSVVFQGYDFNLLSPSTSPASHLPPTFPKDEFLPFHTNTHHHHHHHPSVLSTDASLHALGSSLSAVQGINQDQLNSLDPFDLFFEVPKSPVSSSMSLTNDLPPSVTLTHPTPPSSKTLGLEKELKNMTTLEDSMDPTWNDNLLLGGGHLADYFAQIEDQFLL